MNYFLINAQRQNNATGIPTGGKSTISINKSKISIPTNFTTFSPPSPAYPKNETMTQEEKDKLKAKLLAIDEAVTLPKLKQAVEAMLQFSINLQNKTESDLKTIAESVKTAISRIETTASENYTKTQEKLTQDIENTMNNMMLQHEAMMSECDAKMSNMQDGVDGMDADEEVIVGKVLAQIPEPKEETPEEVRDMLETLTGEERLKIDAIDKLREELDRLEKEIKQKVQPVVGGSRGVGVLDEGQTVNTNAHWLNFTGAGVSVSTVGEQTVIAITGGGAGSTTPIQESGTIADLTTIVTLAHTPYTGTLMLYINEAFVDPSRYSVNGSNAIIMGAALDASYAGLRYTAIYQYV